MNPKSDKEIKEMIAGFQAPIRRTKEVIALMRNKLSKSKLKGKAGDEALRRIDDVESLVFYSTDIQAKLNESNESVAKWGMAYGRLKFEYEDKCRKLDMMEKVSELGADVVTNDILKSVMIKSLKGKSTPPLTWLIDTIIKKDADNIKIVDESINTI
jgi:hypothetical protein